jgi:KaiC/GvpD/RAD55 family RecA-like ATPase
MTQLIESRGAPLRAPTLRALLGTQFPPREHLLDPWLRRGESAMVWAAPGVGKTMFAISMALAVAGGGKVLGWASPEPRRVLLVDGEMNVADLRDRCRLLMDTVEGLDRVAAAENITILARQYQKPEADFPDLATERGRKDVLQRAMTGRYGLVILDNFSTLATVEDENAAAAMSPVLQFLMQMKQANIACLLIHHANKGGEAFRGSSKLATTFEVIVGLHQMDGPQLRHRAAFRLCWDKYRGLRDGSIRANTVWLETDEDGAARWHHELSEDEESSDLVSLVRSLRHTTQAELADALGCSTGKLSKLKARAIHTAKLIPEREWEECLNAARGLREEAGGADDTKDWC